MVKHAILSIGFLMAGPLAAQTTVVTFDNGGEGWDGNGSVEQDGGNPGRLRRRVLQPVIGGEVSGELLHLADGVRLAPFHKKVVVEAHEIVALPVARNAVCPSCQVFLNLREDPRV